MSSTTLPIPSPIFNALIFEIMAQGSPLLVQSGHPTATLADFFHLNHSSLEQSTSITDLRIILNRDFNLILEYIHESLHEDSQSLVSLIVNGATISDRDKAALTLATLTIFAAHVLSNTPTRLSVASLGPCGAQFVTLFQQRGSPNGQPLSIRHSDFYDFLEAHSPTYWHSLPALTMPLTLDHWLTLPSNVLPPLVPLLSPLYDLPTDSTSNN